MPNHSALVKFKFSSQLTSKGKLNISEITVYYFPCNFKQLKILTFKQSKQLIYLVPYYS